MISTSYYAGKKICKLLCLMLWINTNHSFIWLHTTSEIHAYLLDSKYCSSCALGIRNNIFSFRFWAVVLPEWLINLNPTINSSPLDYSGKTGFQLMQRLWGQEQQAWVICKLQIILKTRWPCSNISNLYTSFKSTFAES